MSGVDFDRREGRATGLSKEPRSEAHEAIADEGFKFIEALRARGIEVHGVIFDVFRTPTERVHVPIWCRSLPKVEQRQ